MGTPVETALNVLFINDFNYGLHIAPNNKLMFLRIVIVLYCENMRAYIY